MNDLSKDLSKQAIPDVQSLYDRRNVPIQRVGVRHVAHPMLADSSEGPQPVTVFADMCVALPVDQKGTHMSRFPLLLDDFERVPLNLATVERLSDEMLERLNATEGHIELRFTYFVKKSAPVTGRRGYMNYEVRYTAAIEGGRRVFTQEVQVPVTSLCPCSKEISQYGAHNQRSHLTVAIRTNAPFPIEEQIRIAERCGSCEVYSVLKRPDEKYVTEYAYDHPKFVEDIVRDTAVALDRDPRITSFRIHTENFESIHNHSAYAMVEHDKTGR